MPWWKVQEVIWIEAIRDHKPAGAERMIESAPVVRVAVEWLLFLRAHRIAEVADESRDVKIVKLDIAREVGTEVP